MNSADDDAPPTRPAADRPLDSTTVALASGQEGSLTTRQLLDLGHSPTTLLALVADEVLLHPGRGLYLVRAAVGDDPLDRHHSLVAGARVMYPDAVLASTTALLAHGVTVWGAPLGTPCLFRPVKRGGGGMSAFWVRPMRGSTVDTPWGPASPVAEALAQHAVDHGLAPGLVSADHALHEQLVTVDALTAAVAAVSRMRNGARATAMLAHADGRRESVGESRTHLLLSLAGFDVEPQPVIRDERGDVVARVDFAVRGTNVLVEFDGRVKYESGDPSVLWAEKKREDRLRRLGYVVVRIRWEHLERPGAVAALVSAALKAA